MTAATSRGVPACPVGKTPVPRLPRWLDGRVTCRAAILSVCSLLGSGADAQDSPDPSFHLPGEWGGPAGGDLARMVDPSNDSYATEVYAEEIAAELHALADRLLVDPPAGEAVRSLLAPGFRGAPLEGSDESKRQGALAVFESSPSKATILDEDQFVAAFSSLVDRHGRLESAEFHVTGLSANTARGETEVESAVHYALFGPASDGNGSVQQTGEWILNWTRSASGWIVRRWQTSKHSRAEAVPPLFIDVTEQSLGANESYRRQLILGVDHWRAALDGAIGIDVYGHHGVSLGDIDGDGDDDLYVSQPSGLPNRLYRNDGGLVFTDISQASGAGVLDSTSMALFADLDNDGDQDLTLITARAPILLRNDGTGSLQHDADAFRFSVSPRGQLTSAAMADYDRDGDLDLYVCSYRFHAGVGDHRPPQPYHDANNGPANFFLRNRGDGTFEEITAASGLDANNARFSFAAAWADYDADGWPDLYVANDFGRNNLYRNRGDGTFSDVAKLAGVEDVAAGMSVAWLDHDADGNQDIYVGNMWSSAGLRISDKAEFRAGSATEALALYRRHAKGNSLFRGLGEGRFQEVSSSAGVDRGRWAWSSDAVDLDNDGYEELYVVNGYVTNAGDRDL